MVRRLFHSYLKNTAEQNLLKPKYRLFFNFSGIVGIVFGIVLFYPVGELLANLLGILPDLPVKEQNNGFLFIVIFILAIPTLIIGGALFSIAIFSLPLLLFNKLELKEFIGLITSSKFPEKWYETNT